MGLFLARFSIALYHSPSDLSHTKTWPLAIYTGFLLVSIIPLLLDLLFGDISHPHEERNWLLAFFSIPHVFLINPLSTLLCFLSFFPQASVVKRGSFPALSLISLVIQSVVFALVGISWLGRLNFGSPEDTFLGWYLIFGWPAVDNFLFATVQATLFCFAIHWRWRLGPEFQSNNQPNEASPLLGQEAPVLEG
jgi:hypothetical protein